MVLEDPNVSRFHAEVRRVDGRVEVRDLGSRNGTRVNGELVATALLEPGSEVGIGPYSLIFDGAVFVARSEQGALRLDAERVAMQVGDKQILDRDDAQHRARPVRRLHRRERLGQDDPAEGPRRRDDAHVGLGAP